MKSNLIYDFMGEKKSQVVVLNIIFDDDDYLIFHCLNDENNLKMNLYQSRNLSINEIDKISSLFTEKNIPDFIFDSFQEECIVNDDDDDDKISS